MNGAPLLTLKDLCARLRCSRQTVWRAVSRGELRSGELSPGGSPRFDPADVQEFIDKMFERGRSKRPSKTGGA